MLSRVIEGSPTILRFDGFARVFLRIGRNLLAAAEDMIRAATRRASPFARHVLIHLSPLVPVQSIWRILEQEKGGCDKVGPMVGTRRQLGMVSSTCGEQAASAVDGSRKRFRCGRWLAGVVSYPPATTTRTDGLVTMPNEPVENQETPCTDATPTPSTDARGPLAPVQVPSILISYTLHFHDCS